MILKIKPMNKPIISDNFTIEDIHKIREYNHEVTKKMSFEERRKYYANGADNFKRLIEKNKPQKS